MALNITPPSGEGARAYSDPLARINIYDGSVRSGKTITTILRWAKALATGEVPSGPLMISGKTERTVKQNIIDPITEIFPQKYYHYSVGNHELTLFGRKHTIVGANDARSEQKIRGITLAGVLADEVTLQAESFVKMTLSRLSVPGAPFLGTTNPDSPMHWLKQEYLDRADEIKLKRHKFTLDDNPNLDPDFVAALKTEYVGLWYKRFILGEWVVAEGAVYDMFDPDTQSVDWPTVPSGRWRVAGVDYGTTNPTVFVAMTMMTDEFCRNNGLKPGTMILHDEWRWDSKKTRSQMTAAEYSAEFSKWKKALGANRDATGQKVERTDVDPTANGFILQLWRDGERGVRAGDNDVLAGIMEVSSLLYQGRLKFHRPSMKTAMEEMAAYAWDPDQTLKGKDEVLKVADHAPDAIRYMVRGNRAKWRYADDEG